MSAPLFWSLVAQRDCGRLELSARVEASGNDSPSALATLIPTDLGLDCDRRVYYVICFAILLRLFSLHLRFPPADAALALVVGLMLINASWNTSSSAAGIFSHIHHRRPLHIRRACPFLSLTPRDRRGALWLAPYLLYLAMRTRGAIASGIETRTIWTVKTSTVHPRPKREITCPASGCDGYSHSHHSWLNPLCEAPGVHRPRNVDWKRAPRFSTATGAEQGIRYRPLLLSPPGLLLFRSFSAVCARPLSWFQLHLVCAIFLMAGAFIPRRDTRAASSPPWAHSS